MTRRLPPASSSRNPGRARARAATMPFACVVFDVDSTLSAIEGIDELARLRGVDVCAAVSALTERAMRGELPLEAVYGERLRLAQPGARELAQVGELYVRRLLPGMRGLVAELLRAGVEVRLVSGGLRPALLPLLVALKLPGDALDAVDVRLDARGRYLGFDQRSPLARADGKRTLLARRRARDRRTLLVGDGATDLAARPEIDAFCAFTAIASRAAVVAGADHVAHSVTALRTLLGLARSGPRRRLHR